MYMLIPDKIGIEQLDFIFTCLFFSIKIAINVKTTNQYFFKFDKYNYIEAIVLNICKIVNYDKIKR